MTRFRQLLSSMTAIVLAACTVEEEVDICHFPDASEDYDVIQVAASELESHILEHGDLCFSVADDTCYPPDIDGWEAGGEFCPS